VLLLFFIAANRVHLSLRLFVHRDVVQFAELQRLGFSSGQTDLTSLTQETTDTFGNLASMRFQRKMAGVEEADNRTRVVPPERLGAGRQKERVVFAPHR
jgi:hypothetical protein